jgi:hypothetical protein
MGVLKTRERGTTSSPPSPAAAAGGGRFGLRGQHAAISTLAAAMAKAHGLPHSAAVAAAAPLLSLLLLRRCCRCRCCGAAAVLAAAAALIAALSTRRRPAQEHVELGGTFLSRRVLLFSERLYGRGGPSDGSWPKRWQLARAFPWGCSCERLRSTTFP